MTRSPLWRTTGVIKFSSRITLPAMSFFSLSAFGTMLFTMNTDSFVTSTIIFECSCRKSKRTAETFTTPSAKTQESHTVFHQGSVGLLHRICIQNVEDVICSESLVQNELLGCLTQFCTRVKQLSSFHCLNFCSCLADGIIGHLPHLFRHHEQMVNVFS